jgi:hypothetical protein
MSDDSRNEPTTTPERKAAREWIAALDALRRYMHDKSIPRDDAETDRLYAAVDAAEKRARSSLAASPPDPGFREALAFAASVIKCGEPWTSECERIIGHALRVSAPLPDALDAPTDGMQLAIHGPCEAAGAGALWRAWWDEDGGITLACAACGGTPLARLVASRVDRAGPASAPAPEPAQCGCGTVDDDGNELCPLHGHGPIQGRR